MSIGNPSIKELDGIKIEKTSQDKKDYKYCTVRREKGIHEIKKGNDFYMIHHFDLDSYCWFTYKIRSL